jgi:hypothetical protein
MQYTIVGGGGRRAQVDAPSWMMAMGRAMSKLGLSSDSMGRWVCTPRPNGTVVVEDPVEGQRWVIFEGEGPAPEEPLPVASEKKAPRAAPASEPEGLAERLFDLSFDIAGASSEEGAKLALALIQEFVPCEAASVARGGLNDTCLLIVAASGPVGDKMRGKRIPYGQGIVGLCFDMAITVQVDDVAHHKSHLARIDQETGFQTRETLCVPIRDDMQRMFGVLQLINPSDGFQDWHIECVETVARTLSGPLGAA